MPEQNTQPGFAAFLSEVEALLLELGRPGLVSSPRDVERLMKLFDAGAPLDVVLRGMETGARRRLAGGKEIKKLSELLPAVRAELRRAGVAPETA
jgi:hypothetical protein